MHRVASRYPDRSDQIIMLQMILPGCVITYYGEEIGMTDNTDINLEEAQDVPIKNAGQDLYNEFSRDFYRTPFQWDDSDNAGNLVF